MRSTGGLNDVGGAEVDDAFLQSILDSIESEFDKNQGVELDFISKLHTKVITAKRRLSEYDTYDLQIQLPNGKNDYNFLVSFYL